LRFAQPLSTQLFPYATLFRSGRKRRVVGLRGRARDGDRRRAARTSETDESADAEMEHRSQPLEAPGLDHLPAEVQTRDRPRPALDRKSTRLNSSHQIISYAVF